MKKLTKCFRVKSGSKNFERFLMSRPNLELDEAEGGNLNVLGFKIEGYITKLCECLLSADHVKRTQEFSSDQSQND